VYSPQKRKPPIKPMMARAIIVAVNTEMGWISFGCPSQALF
jgi:hypothetical protein